MRPLHSLLPHQANLGDYQGNATEGSSRATAFVQRVRLLHHSMPPCGPLDQEGHQSVILPSIIPSQELKMLRTSLP